MDVLKNTVLNPLAAQKKNMEANHCNLASIFFDVGGREKCGLAAVALR